MIDLTSKEVFIFDLDGTLAPSKSALEKETADILTKLLELKKCAVISGGNLEQFHAQFLSHIPQQSFTNLLLLPVTGSQLYTWNGTDWILAYSEKHFTNEEKEKITTSIKKAVIDAHIETPEQLYGDQIEDRGTQITYSALGQDAPIDAKNIWDPSHEKRKKILSFLEQYLPEYPKHIGGTTSIDIGWDKGKALKKFLEKLHIDKNSVLFFGDALYAEGNDHPAQEIGLDCVSVQSPADTRAHLQNVLNLLQ